MIKRNITSNLLAALSDTPVVLLNGARQTGKSTLVQSLVSRGHSARYITFDDAGMLSAAKEDPGGFLVGISEDVVLDEIQRVPELFVAIKAQVDRNRKAGRFLLTGSANVLLLPRLAETLAGRMEIISLWPFSQGEIEGQKESFVDNVFAEHLTPITGKTISHSDLVDRMLKGGYPEVLQRSLPARREAWFGSYVTTILQRDVRDLAHIESLTAMPRLLALLASRAASLLNFSELSRSTTLPQSTLKRYIALLETTFLVQFLPAWSSNFGKRLVKSPKILMADTGLMGYLMGLNPQRLEQEPQLIGPLLENFVAMELRKQMTWSETQPKMFHLRTQTGQEVDIILEDARGSLVGIEVKASGTVTAKDIQPLKMVAEALGKKFRRGIILYRGSEVIPFGSNLHAVPVSSLF